MNDRTQIARPRAAAHANNVLPPPTPAAFVLLFAPGETRRLPGHRFRLQHTEASIGRDERHRVRGSMLSLVLFAIDGFPAFLSDQGDLAGDDSLFHVATVLQQATPPAAWELLALLDDNLFALLLPELDSSFAEEKAQAALAGIRAKPFHGSTDVSARFTLSAGVATADLQADALDLRAAAHIALTEAIRAGGNRVVVQDAAVIR